MCLPALQACSKVCAYVSRQVEHVRKSMDGKNVDTVLTELGVRFHRLIHEHLQQYSYSSMGGMLAICDVAEYRRCAKDFRVSRGGIGPGHTGHRAEHGSSDKVATMFAITDWLDQFQ